MKLTCSQILSLSFSIFFRCLSISAKLVNSTIDDTFGDDKGASITYTPSGAWNDGRFCDKCTARPDEAFMTNGTWHDSTFNSQSGSNDFPNNVLSATTRFNGTAVYVNCVLARTVSGPTGRSDMTFIIDGQEVGTFVKEPPGDGGYDYNVLVYSNTSLPSGFHTIVVNNGHVNGNRSLVILDSIVYTYDDGISDAPESDQSNSTDTSSASTTDDEEDASPSNIGPIVGAVVASVVGTLLAVIAFLLYRRRKRNQRPLDNESSIAHPYPTSFQSPPGDSSANLQPPPTQQVPFGAASMTSYNAFAAASQPGISAGGALVPPAAGYASSTASSSHPSTHLYGAAAPRHKSSPSAGASSEPYSAPEAEGRASMSSYLTNPFSVAGPASSSGARDVPEEAPPAYYEGSSGVRSTRPAEKRPFLRLNGPGPSGS